jgi:hypothetical protein
VTALRKIADQRSSLVVDAINALDPTALKRFGAWQPLADLSTRTVFEEIDADPASVNFYDPQGFEALAVIYVTLNFGPSKDEESMSDEYVATVRGQVSDDGAEIQEIAVDVSPFYE